MLPARAPQSAQSVRYPPQVPDVPPPSARLGLPAQIVLLIMALLFCTAGAIILVNRHFYRVDMRAQLVDRELPLVADRILGVIDDEIMEPSRGLRLLAHNPFFLDWLVRGNRPTRRNGFSGCTNPSSPTTARWARTSFPTIPINTSTCKTTSAGS